MALISCPECANQVSTLAASCPNCGAPVVPTAPESVMTIERTSKAIKVRILITRVLFYVLLFFAITSIFSPDAPTEGWFIAAGVALVLNWIAKADRWWTNG